MAYFDLDDQQLTPEAEAENRRRMLGMLASAGKTSVLGARDTQPATPMSQPTVPPPRLNPVAEPNLGVPTVPGKPVLGGLGTGAPVRPARPDVMPTREDFPARPEVSGLRKYLGLGLSALAGPQRAGQLAEGILHGQRDTAERQYGQAVQDWERGQTDAARAATTAETKARTQSLLNPKPERPENLQQAYADAVADAQNRGVDPAKDQKVQQIADAITSLQRQPAAPKENRAVAGTIAGKPAWGVQTDKGWIDPQSGKSIPNFAPAPNYAQVAPGLRTIDILDPTTGLPTIRTLSGQNLGTSATGAYGHEAAQAGAVTRAGDDLIAQIRQNKGKLGNMRAIVNSAFLGTPLADPASAALASQIASFAALNPSMHGFRGSDALRQFEKLVGGLPNNPDAMVAAIQGIQRTAGAINPSLTGPQPGTVEGGYRFKGGDPSDRKNWEKAK